MNEYQDQIIKFDLFDERPETVLIDLAFVDKVLGLVGESGEVADKVKKLIRDKKGKISAKDQIELAKELGDILWYVATTARYLGLTLEDVATANIAKLESRFDHGQLRGSGDNR